MKILLPLYILFTCSGLFFMKMGGDSLSLGLKNGVDFKIGYITIIGFICYIVSFLLWQKIIINNNISTIFALTTGIIQIVVLILGCVFFKEAIKLNNIIGIGLVLIGIFFIIKK